MKGFINHRSSQLAYEKIGHGKQVVIAFHGYSQRGDVFRFFEEELGASVTIFAFDLFGHGETNWLEPEACSPEMLTACIDELLTQHQLPTKGITLLSFSIGSLVALSLLHHQPERYHRIILIAAPSDQFRKLVHFATHNFIGKSICQFIIRFPRVLHWLNHFLGSTHLLSKPRYRFAQLFIQDPNILKLVFHRWNLLRVMLIPFSKAIHSANLSHTEIILLTGKNDKVTPHHAIQKMLRHAKHHRIILLDQYHKLETEMVLQHLKELFIPNNTN